MNAPISPLDKALDAARQNAEKKSAFYNIFLGSELFIPTLDQPIQDSTPRRSQAGEKFSPYIVEHNGKKYLPIFDSFERLSKWIRKQATYVAMPAHALVRAFHGDLYFMLNTGTDFIKEFTPEEIQWLRNTVEKMQPQSRTVPTGTKVFVGVPAQIPAGLEQALRNCLRLNFEIRYAFLGTDRIASDIKQATKPFYSRS
jgi:hypothetical protein